MGKPGLLRRLARKKGGRGGGGGGGGGDQCRRKWGCLLTKRGGGGGRSQSDSAARRVLKQRIPAGRLGRVMGVGTGFFPSASAKCRKVSLLTLKRGARGKGSQHDHQERHQEIRRPGGIAVSFRKKNLPVKKKRRAPSWSPRISRKV